jgi:hypothetical protein
MVIQWAWKKRLICLNIADDYIFMDEGGIIIEGKKLNLKIHKICDVLTVLSVIILILAYVVPDEEAGFVLLAAGMFLIPSWALNSKTWIQAEKSVYLKLQWAFRVIVLVSAVYLMYPKYWSYLKDLNVMITDNVPVISGIPDEVIRQNDNKVMLKIEDKIFWDVEPKSIPMNTHSAYTIKYLPNTNTILSITTASK